MQTSYSTAKVALDEIAQRIQGDRRKLQQIKTTAHQVEADLDAMPSQYGTIISEINDAATNAPNDIAIQNLKAEADKLVAEFTSLKDSATAMRSATDEVSI